MELTVIKKLAIDKEDDCFEIGECDCITIWLKDGDCVVADIQEIRDNELLVTDEDGEKRIIAFKDIEDIQEG